jgi:hypothetical protein
MVKLCIAIKLLFSKYKVLFVLKRVAKSGPFFVLVLSKTIALIDKISDVCNRQTHKIWRVVNIIS